MNIQINRNTLVAGGPDTGKTGGLAVNDILSRAGDGSVVVFDPTGTLYELCAPELGARGINTALIDFVEPENGVHINLLDAVKIPGGRQKLAYTLAYSGVDANYVTDNFTLETVKLFLSCCIGYLAEGGKGFKPDMEGLIRLANLFKAESFGKSDACDASMIFDRHAEVYEKHTGKPSYACELYRRLRQLPEQIMSTVIARAVLALQSFDTPEMRKLTGSSGFDLCSIASTPTVLFVRSSDTDRSADTAVSIIITQLFDSLFSYADHCENKQIPIPVRFVFDDFAALPKIQDFEGLMPSMHSRGISVMLIVQTISRLEQRYGIGAKSITAGCTEKIFTGSSDYETARHFSLLANKSTEKLLAMPHGTMLCVRPGEASHFCETPQPFSTGKKEIQIRR